MVQPGDAWIEAWRQESVGGGIAALGTSAIIQKTLSLYCELGKEHWRIINTLKISHFPNDGAAEQNSFHFFCFFFQYYVSSPMCTVNKHPITKLTHSPTIYIVSSRFSLGSSRL